MKLFNGLDSNEYKIRLNTLSRRIRLYKHKQLSVSYGSG